MLLLDEVFAALDPSAKALVKAELRAFCAASITLVIYHTDQDASAAAAAGGAPPRRCIDGDGFFDENLHFADGTARLEPVC